MRHHVCRVPRGHTLWATWIEGRALWDRVIRACPGLHALVLMPDHVHLLHEHDVRRRLANALGGYARWRRHHRGEAVAGISRVPEPDVLVDRQKVRRAQRYVHLNPCRAGLARDPLEWPLSTHRDACGLAVRPVVAVASDPAQLHRYVSSDPSVHPQGTELPWDSIAAPDLMAVCHAVSAVTRTPLSAMVRRGPGRSLFLKAARTLTDASARQIALAAGMHHPAVSAVAPSLDRDVRVVARALHDPRFSALYDGDLRRLPGWQR